MEQAKTEENCKLIWLFQAELIHCLYGHFRPGHFGLQPLSLTLTPYHYPNPKSDPLT